MTRSKGIKRQQAFNGKVEKLVLKYGAQPSEFYDWKIETRVGLLLVSVHKPRASELFSIFACFDDVEKANSYPNIRSHNTNSGKCNFHYVEENECLFEFEQFLISLKKDNNG